MRVLIVKTSSMGDAAEGYHQSLIDITPQRVLEELNDLLLEKTEQEED